MQYLIQKHESIANGYRHVASLSNQLANLQESRISLSDIGFSKGNLDSNKSDILRTRNRISRMLILIEHLNDNH